MSALEQPPGGDGSDFRSGTAAPALMRAWALAALDLLFPALCPACGAALGDGRRDPLCGPCWRGIQRLGAPACEQCGMPGPWAADADPGPADDGGEVDREHDGRASAPAHRLGAAPAATPRRCGACRRDPPEFDRARGAGLYSGPLRHALHALKFRGQRALARPLADLVGAQCAAVLGAGAAALIPVPLARARLRERGYNQAELLADRLGAALRLPVRRRWLARVRDTAPQTDLAADDRMANVKGAFIASDKVAGRHVVLVDDVFTTGATCRACAAALRAAGARRIDAVTVARVAPP